MAIAYFGQTWIPATDNATTPLGSATPHAITPPGSMTSGQVVLVFVTARNNTDPAVSNAGGQTWTSQTANTNGTTIIGRLFSCVFNGTWSTNPSFSTGSTTDGVCLWMGVFDGVHSTVFDVSPVALDLASASAKTLTGFNTGVDGAWACFIWGEPDDNALSGQDTGWTGFNGSTGSLNDHVGNQGGNDIGLFLSKKTQATAGATGNNTILLTTSDVGAGYYFSLKPGITVKNFSDTLGLTSLTSDPKLTKVIDLIDSVGLTSLTSAPKLTKIIDFTDSIGLSSLTSTPTLNVVTIYNFSDTLALTSLTSTPLLSLITQYNFSDSLNLSSFTSTPILVRTISFSDTLALDSLTSTPKLNRLLSFSDTVNLTSLTSTPILARQFEYSDTLNLTSLTGNVKLTLVTSFSDVLALTSLTSNPKLFRNINISDTLDLTSLTSNAKLAKMIDYSDLLELSSLTSEPDITLGQIFNISDTLNLTSLTSNPKLFREISVADTLNLTSLTSTPPLHYSMEILDPAIVKYWDGATLIDVEGIRILN
jgi:hypothetical protein